MPVMVVHCPIRGAMGVEAADLLRQSVLIVGATNQAGRVGTFLRATGGPIASCPQTLVEDPENISKTLAEAASHGIGLCLLVLPDQNPAWLEALSLFRVDNQPMCPVIVITDDRSVVGQARNEGYSFFLSLEDLNPSQLADTVHAAQENFALYITNRKLNVMHKEAEDRFRDVADQFADWLWEIDDSLTIRFSSSRKRPVKGAEIGGKFTSCFLPDEALRIEDDFAQLMENPRPFQDLDYWSFDTYGSRMCWAVSGVPVISESGKVKGFRGVARDISAAKASVDQLYYLANNDGVTGVYNRVRIMEELARQARQAKRENRSGIFVLLDVDHFAYINETFGHAVGDKLLIHLTQILQDILRSGDILGRMAGDEFALILPDVPANDVEYQINKIQNALKNRPFELPDRSLTLSASLGVVKFPLHGKSADELLNNVGTAVQQAKDKGRNRAQVFAPVGWTTERGEQLEWVDFLHRCLADETQRMVLHYQPIVALKDKTGYELFEVLVRMLDADGQLVPPVKFISVAEDFGLIHQIDRLVTTRAVAAIKTWQEQGREVHLSVNVSPKTFTDEAFLDDMITVIQKAQIPPKSLIMEITETALLQDLALVRKVMEKFAQVGVGFALDDCGVGYSSFNYIRHLPLDFIKIDGSFIRNMHLTTEEDAFVKALADVAHQKNILTIAEMIEHQDTVGKLRTMGIDFGQGYHFAKPEEQLPQDEIKVH